jgi:5'-3' exonuclease
MATPADRLMLLDSASMYFRAFYGVPDTMTSPRGEPVNAIRGFLDMIATLVETYEPTRLVACWDDDWRPAWRVDLMPSYKTHRVAGEAEPGAGGADPLDVVPEESPDALTPQVPVIAEVLAAFGIARVGAARCEADDIIGTLSTRAPAGTEVDVVTGDRDLFQLVDDERRVRVLYIAKGIRNMQLIDQSDLQERYGVATGAQYADLATMRGDASDGIPGVPGIGEKTAATLLKRFGSLDGIRDAVADPRSDLTKAQRARFVAAADYLDVAPVVVKVLRDADVPDHDDSLPTAPKAPDVLDAVADRWGVGSSIDRLRTALAKRAR